MSSNDLPRANEKLPDIGRSRLTPEVIEELLARGARNAEELDKRLEGVFCLGPRQAGLVLR